MSRVTYPVRVVGTGLLGTSVALGLRAHGVDVTLADVSPTNVALAVDLGAGRAATGPDGRATAPTGASPHLVVVAVPPDVTAHVVATELANHPTATVTDVASVKAPVLAALRASGADVTRYVGSHPMAGRERGGPMAARADLFQGRPWVVCASRPGSRRGPDDRRPRARPRGEHRRTSCCGARSRGGAGLARPALDFGVDGAPARRCGRCGGRARGAGVRDVTRVAASAPDLWVQILGANAGPVREVLVAARDDLDRLIAALAAPDAPGARRVVAEHLVGGNAGVARLPGKHGTTRQFTTIVVLVDDRPGELARLLTEIGEIGVNLEDLRLEHAPGRLVGLAEIAVVPDAAAGLVAALEARGWKIAG